MTPHIKQSYVRTGRNLEAAGIRPNADLLTDRMSYSANRSNTKTIRQKIAKSFRMVTAHMGSDACLSMKLGVNKVLKWVNSKQR